MSLSVKTLAPSERMVWFDSNRAIAALGVVLIHCCSDVAGQPFASATAGERIVPVLIRSIAELSGSEMFFLFSLFLISLRLDKRRVGLKQTMSDQAKRLLVPFVFWTVFYAFFRLAKASTFGYQPYILGQLGDWQSWLGYFALGSANYHLHFLPSLFILVLFFPVMRLAERYPITGLAIFGLLGAMESVQGYLYGAGLDPLLRDFLVRGVKILGYVGYGFAAFAFYGFWKQGLPRGEAMLLRRGALFLVVFAYVTTLPYAAQAIATGQWPVRSGWVFYAHFLLPLFVFAAFMGGQYANWSPRWSVLARYTFGVYLVHPIFIDLFDIAIHLLNVEVSPGVMVVTRFAVAAPASIGCAFLLSRWLPLAWTVGLGPAPWAMHHASGKQAPAPKGGAA
jgi:surface polysaccharide O-acyltransferase-like enzyme